MLHVFNTWVLANLFHPLFIYFFWGSMDGEWFDGNYLGFYFLGLIYSFLFSIPLLLIAWLIFYFIRKSGMTAQAKFGAWLFFVTALPLCILLIIQYVSDSGDFILDEIEIVIPASVSCLAAILIRYKQFFNLVAQAATKQDNNDPN